MPDMNYWLNANPTTILYKCVELTHPSFTKPFYIVQNSATGLTVTHEDGVTRDYEYVPIDIQMGTNSDDLDQEIKVAVGDLGDIFPAEIKRIRNSTQYAHVEPILNYREYLSTDLTKPFNMMLGLLLKDKADTDDGAIFDFRAERMSTSKTGIVSNLDNTPTARGFL